MCDAWRSDTFFRSGEPWWLEPLASEAPAVGSPAAAALRFAPPMAWGLSGRMPPGRARAFRRAVLANGIPVLGQERPQSRSFALRCAFPLARSTRTIPRSPVAFLTARSLQRGSGGRSFEEINTRLDELGGSITVDAGREFVEARVRGLREDFAELVDMLANALQRPDFPAVEVDKVKAEQLGAIAEADNDTRATADRLLRRSIYPSQIRLGAGFSAITRSSPDWIERRLPAITQRRSVRRVPRLRSSAGSGSLVTHSRRCRPRSTRGTVHDERSISRIGSLQRCSGPCHGGDSRQEPGRHCVGVATIPRGHRDYYALDVGNLILGRLGLMGRLGAEVRDRQGWPTTPRASSRLAATVRCGRRGLVSIRKTSSVQFRR